MVDRNDGLGDTTFTKIFVGGLAWETRRDTMRCYFEQFGEILEAVVISDKNTGKSKGYGFVTFRDPESARRACENPCPVIDGRRANCNLASLGAQKNRPTATSLGGMNSLLLLFSFHNFRSVSKPLPSPNGRVPDLGTPLSAHILFLDFAASDHFI
ncbi:hypothetical protein CDL15_Pgr023086 [Punica granatum]|uniref:RRM domain-containing protein n=1 Tax=Punica granatum TaxID=22663 RepID=A0A218X421_PUNGR|nr:hypothetical protein CDL15_Pgr023086 [Punica granatum]